MTMQCFGEKEVVQIGVWRKVWKILLNIMHMVHLGIQNSRSKFRFTHNLQQSNNLMIC